MKKNASQKAGWLFVAVFVGLHLLYCALNLMRCLLGRRPPFGIDSPLYRAVKRPLTVLRLFLAGPNLGWSTEPQDVMGWSMESQDITGACLIGVFVVAATVWLLARYGTGAFHLVVQNDGDRGGRKCKEERPDHLLRRLHVGPFPKRRVCVALPDPLLAAVWGAAENIPGYRSGRGRMMAAALEAERQEGRI